MMINQKPVADFVAPLASLNHLGFTAYAPHLSLSRWVQCYWQVKTDNLPRSGVLEKLYPDGGSSLTFHFNCASTCVFDGRSELTEQLFKGKVDTLGIRFHPGGAYQLLGQQISDCHGFHLSVEALGLVNFSQLQQQLSEASTTSQRIKHLNNWLLYYAKRSAGGGSIVQYLWPKLSQNMLGIEALFQSIGLSRRQIERKFQHEIGLSPANLKLLHQVKCARQLIAANPTTQLTEVALASGFYDQAHFIRQFRKVTQQTPGQYRSKKMSQKYNS